MRRRAVSFVNGGEISGKNGNRAADMERMLPAHHQRNYLLQHCVLSRVYEQKQAAGDQEAQIIIKDVSTVAWQNVNMFGSLKFNPSTSKIDIDALVARFADPVFWSKVLKERQEQPLGCIFNFGGWA